MDKISDCRPSIVSTDKELNQFPADYTKRIVDNLIKQEEPLPVVLYHSADRKELVTKIKDMSLIFK